MSELVNRAAEINRLHEEIGRELRVTVQKAIRIGELLTEEKRECRRGNWLPWLEGNIKFSQQTASRYIRLFQRRDQLLTLSNLSLTDAYKIADIAATPVKEELEEPPAKPEGESFVPTQPRPDKAQLEKEQQQRAEARRREEDDKTRIWTEKQELIKELDELLYRCKEIAELTGLGRKRLHKMLDELYNIESDEELT